MTSLDDHQALRDLLSAARCWSWCETMTRGSDREMCNKHFQEAVSAASKYLYGKSPNADTPPVVTER